MGSAAAERGAAAPPAIDATAGGNVNAVVFWPVVLLVVLADLLSKAIAAYALAPAGFPHALFGEWFRVTLVYNPGAAFGLHVGPWSRWIFLALTVVVLGVLRRLYRETAPYDNRRTLALALVSAGAVGNALDRIRSSRGVVDFIDIGAGTARWPTFNVADMAVTTGAVLLAWVLWGEDAASATATAIEPAAGGPVDAAPTPEQA